MADIYSMIRTDLLNKGGIILACASKTATGRIPDMPEPFEGQLMLLILEDYADNQYVIPFAEVEQAEDLAHQILEGAKKQREWESERKDKGRVREGKGKLEPDFNPDDGPAGGEAA